MLKSMREGMKPVMWAVAIAFVASLFILGAGTLTKIFQKEKDEAVLIVNGTKIKEQDFADRWSFELMALLRQYYNQTGGNPDEATIAKFQEQARLNAADYLINEQLMLDEADKLNIVVTDWEIRDFISESEMFQVEGEFDVGLYERVLASEFNLTKAQYEDYIRTLLIMSRLEAVIGETARISETELRDNFFEDTETAECIFVRFPVKGAERPEIGDKQVKKYYEEHKDDYNRPVEVRLEYILLSYQEMGEKVEVTDAEVKEAYDAAKFDHLNKGEFRLYHILIVPDEMTEEGDKRALARAEAVKTKLDAGAGFGEIATEYSMDPGSAVNGGDLGWVTRGTLIYEFEEVAFALDVNEISDPLQTQFGWHIILRGPDAEPFDLVKDKLKDEIKSRKTSELTVNKAMELHGLVANGQAIEEVAKAHGFESVESAYFPFNGIFEEYGAQPSLSMEAFTAEEGTLGELYPLEQSIAALNFSIPIGYLVWQLEDRREPTVAPFDEVADRVKTDAEDAHILDELEKKADEFYEAAKGKKPGFVETSATLGLTTETTGPFTSAQPPVSVGQNPYFAAAAFDTDEGQITPPVRSPNGYYVIKLLKKTRAGESDFLAQKDKYMDEISETKRRRLLGDWQTTLRMTAEVEDNSKNWLDRIIREMTEGPEEQPANYGGGIMGY
ncbi:MAG: hypothetical protein GY771_14865 [bacterium]|nr:hypothetical protein [bacterium]